MKNETKLKDLFESACEIINYVVNESISSGQADVLLEYKYTLPHITLHIEGIKNRISMYTYDGKLKSDDNNIMCIKIEFSDENISRLQKAIESKDRERKIVEVERLKKELEQ